MSLMRIYLDHAATTPLTATARAAMAAWLDSGAAGNPSSLHAEGRRAKAAIDASREAVSRAMGARFAEVIFTSGGTESANFAIVGSAIANQDVKRNRILLGAAEHHCVLHTEAILQRLGYKVEYLSVDSEARVDLGALSDRLADDVLLVSVMQANNELGSINPWQEAGKLVKEQGALFHTDAVQTFGKVGWVPVEESGADLVSVTAHKLGGPAGAGALYIRAGVKLKPLVAGGGQERELRGGTENTTAIVGFGAAVGETGDPSSARDLFLKRLTDAGAVASVTPGSPTLPGHAHVRFPGVPAETLLIRLDRAGVSASGGSACASGSLESSHVLRACGYAPNEAAEALRFSFGNHSTREEAIEASNRVIEAAETIRESRDRRVR